MEFVALTFGLELSQATVLRLLKRNNTTQKRGPRVNIKFTTEKDAQFLQDVYQVHTPVLAQLSKLCRLSDCPDHASLQHRILLGKSLKVHLAINISNLTSYFYSPQPIAPEYPRIGVFLWRDAGIGQEVLHIGAGQGQSPFSSWQYHSFPHQSALLLYFGGPIICIHDRINL